EPVEEVLHFWWRELDFDYQVRFAPYNQVFQQLLDPAGIVGGNRAGVNVLLVRLEDWARGRSRLDKLEANVGDFVSMLERAASKSPVPYLVCLCPASDEFRADAGRAELERRLERQIVTKFDGLGAVHVVPSSEILDLYPVDNCHDPHGDRLGHVPYTPEFFAALGTVIARKIHAMRTAPFKVVALDCDQTLWSGVCSEDGPEGVTVDEAHNALQQFMVGQHDSGMLLSLVSKNNEEDVWDTFAAHPAMPLGRNHLVTSRINWDPKPHNLRAMAEELQLGLDSFIFVDDSPTECAAVEASCPEVLTLELPKEPTAIPGFLRHVWAFDHLTATEEDKKRTAMYGQRLERRKLEHKVTTLAEFLDALELEVEITPVSEAEIPRVAQLIQRTNQMNLTTIRRTESELRELKTREGAECLTVHLKDRFGSYGLVGVALYSLSENALELDTLLLSCRALGRGVEHRMLARLGEVAAATGKPALHAGYTKTAKNRPALDFLRSVAAPHETVTDDGYLYSIPAAEAAAIRYNPESVPGAPSQAHASAQPVEAAQRTVDYRRIAAELNTASAVLARVRAEVRSDAASTIPYEAPRTPLENQLTEIWQEMLSVPQVGVNDNFFDLGGHSLMAVQLLSRVRETFQVDLSLDVVFTGNFSVAELAKAIEVFEIEQAGSEGYAAILEELEGLSDEEVRALIEEEEKAQGSGNGAS
ncbi:MAG: HAD-IIIC family phosphatase, partial [bacterium]|nr:HAD-IIIC family phosphatase [bacterium]